MKNFQSVKRLYLLILRSFIGPFFLIFFIVLFVLLIQFLWRYIDELVGKGLDTKTISQLLLYTSASLVPMALPLSILMASLMTFGNLGERYELTAIKASGISLQRIMRPLIVVVFILSIGAFFFANNILPFANLQMRSLLYDIRQQRPELQIKAGEFNNLIEGYSIRINEKDSKTNTLYGLTIYNHSDGKGNTSVTLADSGTMSFTANEQYLIITLYSGHSYTELFDDKKRQNLQSYPHRFDSFDEQQILVELTGFGLQRTDQNLFKSHYSMLNLKQLKFMEDSLNKEISAKQDQMYKSLVAGNYFKNQNQKPRLTNLSKNTIDNKYIPTLNSTRKYRDSAKVRDHVKPRIKEKYKDAIENEKDTINSNTVWPINNTAEFIDTDSLYETLTLQEKSKVTDLALNYTRTAKNLIVNSSQSIDYKKENLRRYEIEWHRKFTISIACLLFMFIGAPLGAIIRKGGLGLPLIISVFFFIFYYILSLIGEKLVRESILIDYQGMWMTSGLFAIIGAFITYKATTDSSIFNMDTYSNFVKKIFGQRYSVVDKINIQTQKIDKNVQEAKIENLYSSLIDLKGSIDKLIETTLNNLRITDFIFSIFSIYNESELIIFEKYYHNTFKAIINHSVFHNKSIRAKIYEFPALNAKEFQDSKLTQYIRAVLACIPPFTIIIIARHYIKITVLRAKLRQIKQLIPELGTLLKISDSSEKDYENITSL
jgi:lipopolysaccharide export system permease protein